MPLNDTLLLLGFFFALGVAVGVGTTATVVPGTGVTEAGGGEGTAGSATAVERSGPEADEAMRAVTTISVTAAAVAMYACTQFGPERGWRPRSGPRPEWRRPAPGAFQALAARPRREAVW